MRVFHRTTAGTAEAILRDGFRDSVGTFMTANKYSGVWVSADAPLGHADGAPPEADTVLSLEIPAELFERYEWVEEGKGYREALIPAKELNTAGEPSVVSQEERDANWWE